MKNRPRPSVFLLAVALSCCVQAVPNNALTGEPVSQLTISNASSCPWNVCFPDATSVENWFRGTDPHFLVLGYEAGDIRATGLRLGVLSGGKFVLDHIRDDGSAISSDLLVWDPLAGIVYGVETDPTTIIENWYVHGSSIAFTTKLASLVSDKDARFWLYDGETERVREIHTGSSCRRMMHGFDRTWVLIGFYECGDKNYTQQFFNLKTNRTSTKPEYDPTHQRSFLGLHQGGVLEVEQGEVVWKSIESGRRKALISSLPQGFGFFDMNEDSTVPVILGRESSGWSLDMERAAWVIRPNQGTLWLPNAQAARYDGQRAMFAEGSLIPRQLFVLNEFTGEKRPQLEGDWRAGSDFVFQGGMAAAHLGKIARGEQGEYFVGEEGLYLFKLDRE